jgi:hypothetical protein
MVARMEGLLLFAGLFSVLVLLIPTGLLVGLLVVFALRTDADESGGRASALYLSMATFVALFTALAALFTLSGAVVSLAADDPPADGGWFSYPPGEGSFEMEGSVSFGDDPWDDEFEPAPSPSGARDADDRAIDGIVASLIVLVVSGAVLWFHRPRLERHGAAHLAGTSAWRVRRAFRLVTCLTAVLLVLVTASLGLYGVWSVAAPGISGAGDRGDAVQRLIPVLVLLAGSAAIFRLHWDDEAAPPVTAAVAP